MVEKVTGTVIKMRKERPSVISVGGFFYTIDLGKGEQRTKEMIQKDIDIISNEHYWAEKKRNVLRAASLKKQLEGLKQEMEENTK
jgi:ABC-type phosphate transport system auxiliary subunit